MKVARLRRQFAGFLGIGGIDVAIPLGWLRNSSLRAVKLGDFEQYVVASPGYLPGGRRPNIPEDLLNVDWVALTLLPTLLTWKFTGPAGEPKLHRLLSAIPGRVKGRLKVFLTACTIGWLGSAVTRY